jgi:nucleoside 2-deoxyribosyltransferase
MVMHRKKNIYLAGTISGLSHDEARFGWRKEFSLLLPEHIQCSSPMRAKEFLRDAGKLYGSYEEHPMASAAGIVTRDRHDVKNCDAMIACFLEGKDQYSLGTAIEFGWADGWHKPIIMIAEEGDPHRVHPMMSDMAGYIVDNLEDAAHLVTHLLTPGV